LDAKAVPNIVGEFLKPCGNRVQVNLFSSTRVFPLEGKDGLALLGQVDAEKCRSRWVKNFASAGIRPKTMYGFGNTGCKEIVAEFTARRS
jgi:hypothetical protein